MKKDQKITAEMNHGRWIVICPRCAEEGMIVAMETKPGNVFVCPQEYPDLLATTLIPNPRMKGAFLSVPDEGLRDETTQRAIDAGNCYEVIFPAGWEMIERVLRTRPVAARNWREPTTLDELRRENAERGVKHA